MARFKKWFICGHCGRKVRWRKPAHFVTVFLTDLTVDRRIACSTDCAASLEDYLLKKQVAAGWAR